MSACADYHVVSRASNGRTEIARNLTLPAAKALRDRLYGRVPKWRGLHPDEFSDFWILGPEGFEDDAPSSPPRG